MQLNRIVGAALAAWFSVAAAAQDPAAASPSTTARLAAAALAEARGDVDAAVRELQAAAATASNDDVAKVQAALAALRQRQGHEPGQAPRVHELLHDKGFGAVSAESQDPQQDPVQRLIDVIDRGAMQDVAILEAWRQLEQLGVLAIPQMVQAMPRLGPFGLRNTLDLLVRLDDARVLTALRGLLAQKDPAVAATLAQLFDDMAPNNKRALAEQLATADHEPPVRFQAFRILVQLASDPDQLTKLARELLGVRDLHGQLLTEAQFSSSPWAKQVFAELSERGEGSVRSFATEKALLNTEDLTEDRALAGLSTMDASHRISTATTLVQERLTWVRVGVLALAAEPSAQAWLQAWFQRMEWWRRPDEAVAALLALPTEAMTQPRLRGAIDEIVRSGWRMPKELEPAFERLAQAGSWITFVSALPDDDGEARAIAAWQRSGPSGRQSLVHAAVHLGRPWHDLIVHHLASVTSSKDLETHLLMRDWSGASAETVRKLAELVANWQSWRQAPTQPIGTATSTPFIANSNWRQALCDAARQWPGVPIEILLPMVRAEEPGAWQILTNRDPLAGLAQAERWQDLSPIASQVVYNAARHGDRRHLELVIRALRCMQTNNQAWQGNDNYMTAYGAGEPAVIALAKQPPPAAPGDTRGLEGYATNAARGARVRDLDELLKLLPELSDKCATTLLDALAAQLRPEHGPSLSRALSACLEAALSPERCATELQLGRFWPVRIASVLLDHLTRLGVERAIPLAQRILAQPDANDELVRSAVLACITVAADNRTRLLGELLDDARPTVLGWALTAKDLRDDAGLREKAIAAILRRGSEIESLDMLFENLRPEDQLAFATQLLEHERFPRFSRGVAISILRTLGDRKNGDLADTLWRGASHSDADVRQQTAWHLGRTFAKQAAPFLLELLKDDDDKVRARAATSLEEISSYLDAREKWQDRLK